MNDCLTAIVPGFQRSANGAVTIAVVPEFSAPQMAQLQLLLYPDSF